MRHLNPWAVLGVTPGQTKDELRRAYKAKMRRCHPDVEGGSQEAASEANFAMEVLTHCLVDDKVPTLEQVHRKIPQSKAPQPPPRPQPVMRRVVFVSVGSGWGGGATTTGWYTGNHGGGWYTPTTGGTGAF